MGSAQKTGSLRFQIVKAFFVLLIPVLLFVTLAVELFFVPTIELSARQELANSTNVLTSAVRAGAAVAIRNHLRAIAERNLEIARHHLSLAEQGVLSFDEAKERLQNILLSQVVGTSGYIYCLDSAGTVVVHPNNALRGTNVADFAFVRDQISRKEGYLEYDWKNPGESHLRPKALYMVYFEPLDWIISASSYRSEFNELLNPEDFREAVSSLRFGDSGYAYVINLEGETLIHPSLKNYNVLQQNEMPSDFAKEMIEKGAGSLDYSWRNPGESEIRRKIAVYQTIEEYGWLVVSSAYLDEVMKPVNVARFFAYGSTLLLLLAASLTGYWLSGRITWPVDKMMRQIDKNAREGLKDPLPVLGDDELGRLASEFNNFLVKLDKQNAALRHQQEQYQNLFEASPDAIFLLRGLIIVDCNRTTYEMFQGDETSVLGKTVVELSPRLQPDGSLSAERATTLVEKIVHREMSVFEWKHQTITGENFDTEVRIKSFKASDGEVLSLAFVRNITEQKKAENALRESESKYRQLIESANDAIFIAQNGKIVFANNKTSQISEYDNSEIVEVPFMNLIHPDDAAMVGDRHIRRLSGEKNVPPTYPFRLVTKSNKERVAQLSTVLIEWNNKPATLNFLKDITEQKKMEEMFQQAQKMEAIGTLAGGIAHDFNNLMMGIQGRVSLLAVSQRISPAEREHLADIEEYIESATGLTRQLLGFARGGKYDLQTLDLSKLIVACSRMFGRTRKEIDISFDLSDAPVLVEGDKSQIEQVLLNIYVNAWQAMPGGGELKIDLETVDLDDDFCIPYNVEAGRYALLSIADTGAGMDKTVCERIFDPFFTTKDKTRGTGLGLASAYGIIKNHNGFITVESTVKVGSTFCVYLPVSGKPLSLEKKRERILAKGVETVLVVDDEDMILEVSAALLEDLGYQVVKAKGGAQAIAFLEAQKETIDLVILDLIMPELDGIKTLDLLREIDPFVPIILSSGYAADSEASEIINRGSCSFLQKPFTMSDLSQKVREAIEG